MTKVEEVAARGGEHGVQTVRLRRQGRNGFLSCVAHASPLHLGKIEGSG